MRSMVDMTQGSKSYIIESFTQVDTLAFETPEAETGLTSDSNLPDFELSTVGPTSTAQV